MSNNVPYLNQFHYNYYQNLSYYQNYNNFNQNYHNYPNKDYYQLNRYNINTSRNNYESNYKNNNNKYKRNKNNKIFNESRLIECKVCNLFFKSNKQLEEHVNDTHIKCSFKECSFSSPLEILEVHKLKHIENENGESVIDSKEETIKWINSRIQNFPRSSNQNSNLKDSNKHEIQPNGIEEDKREDKEDSTVTEDNNKEMEKKDDKCLLEIYLRNNMNDKKEETNNTKSIVYPMLNKVYKQPSALIRYTNPYKYESLLRRMDSLNSPYSFKSSITEKVVKSKDFKNGRNFNKKCIDYSIPKRPPAFFELIRNDINRIDNLVVDSIKAIVQNNFFDN